MRRMARLPAITAVLLVALLLLSACAPDSHGLDPQKPVTISVWHYYTGNQNELFDQAVEEFNNTIGREKGIIVDAASQGSVQGLASQVLDAQAKKVGALEMPCVFASYADTAYTLYLKGALADLSEYLTKDEVSQFIPAYIDEGRFSDNADSFFIFPVAKSTEALFLNKTAWDLFAAETGATTDAFQTWEGLSRIAKDYFDWTDAKTPDVPNDGKAFFGRDVMANYMLVGAKQLGHELFVVNDGVPTYDLNRDALKRLWQAYYVPYISGHYAAYGRFRSDDAKTGDIAAFVGATSGAPYFPREVTHPDGTVEPIEGAVYVLPNFEGTSPMAISQGAGMVVSKTDKVKEYASTVFLKWFVAPEQNIRFSIQSGYLPVTLEATKPDNLNNIMASKGLSIDPLTQDSVYVGLTISNTYALYTSMPFEGGNDVRNVLTDSLQNYANEGLAKVKALILEGVPRDEAIAQLSADDAFDQWVERFEAALSVH